MGKNLRYPSRSRRRRRESFTGKDRTTLYLANAATHPDYRARCVLCSRLVKLHGERNDPAVAVAGHVIARVDGGGPSLPNGRIECQRCSWDEGRARFVAASITTRRRRRGRVAADEQPTSSLGRWLVARNDW